MCGATEGGLSLDGVNVAKEAVIQGQVLRGDEPVPNAYVRLLDRTGEFTAEVPTSATGHFRFFAGDGEWTLRTLAPRPSRSTRASWPPPGRSPRSRSPSEHSTFDVRGARPSRHQEPRQVRPAGALAHEPTLNGHPLAMTEMNQQDARVAALQGVVDRVSSWQETAPEGTIEDELERGLREAGVTLTAEQRGQVVQQISDGQEVDVEALASDSEAGGPA